MRINEILNETTGVGGIAVVAQPMTTIRRQPKKKRKNESGLGETSPMVKDPAASKTFTDKKSALAYKTEHGGKVLKSEFTNPRTGETTTKYKVVKEAVEVNEAKIDKSNPIAKEYYDMKKLDIKALRRLVAGQHRIIDTTGINSKDQAISMYLRSKYGDNKVDQAFGFTEETELDEAIKLKTKVKIHAPGKGYHNKAGTVGEIRHGLYKGAPKTYTVDYEHDGSTQSIQLDKKNIKLHKEETDLDEGKATASAAIKRSEAAHKVAINKAKRWMKRTGKSAEDAVKEFDLFKDDVKHLKEETDLDEAVAKIACVKCDEVSTAAAWKKNKNFCPKCKKSNQGVAEARGERGFKDKDKASKGGSTSGLNRWENAYRKLNDELEQAKKAGDTKKIAALNKKKDAMIDKRYPSEI